MIAGLPQQQSQRASGLRGQRDAATVEAMPDNPHGIGGLCARRLQNVCFVHLVLCEFDRRIVGVLQRMETIVPEAKRRRVGFGQPHKQHRRLAIEQDEQFHEPAVGGARDEHLRTGEQQPALVAFQPRADGMEVAAGVGLGGAEDRKRSALRKAGQMPRLLALRPKCRHGRHRTDR